MDNRFDRACSDLIGIEGGYADHPNDRGGATKYGISLRFLRQIKPGATAQTIRELTAPCAKSIYWHWFWIPARCGELPEGIGEVYFPIVVNLPRAAAVRVLQRAINQAGGKVVVDGICGPRTVAAAHGVNEIELRRRLQAQLCRYYHELAMELGERIRQHVFADMRAWKAQGVEFHQVALNLSTSGWVAAIPLRNRKRRTVPPRS